MKLHERERKGEKARCESFHWKPGGSFISLSHSQTHNWQPEIPEKRCKGFLLTKARSVHQFWLKPVAVQSTNRKKPNADLPLQRWILSPSPSASLSQLYFEFYFTWLHSALSLKSSCLTWFSCHTFCTCTFLPLQKILDTQSKPVSRVCNWFGWESEKEDGQREGREREEGREGVRERRYKLRYNSILQLLSLESGTWIPVFVEPRRTNSTNIRGGCRSRWATFSCCREVVKRNAKQDADEDGDGGC